MYIDDYNDEDCYIKIERINWIISFSLLVIIYTETIFNDDGISENFSSKQNNIGIVPREMYLKLKQFF